MNFELFQGDCLDILKTIKNESVHSCVTSPPYWGLRDYGVEGQLGLEKTPEEYVAKMVEVFREVKRVLRDDGTLWLNLGDSYSQSGRGGHSTAITGEGKDKSSFQKQYVPKGLKPKDLVGIPWRVAFALQADGWYLRSDIIWHKPNPMPESVTDRPTKSHEYIFLLSKSAKYYYDNDAVKEPYSLATLQRNTYTRGSIKSGDTKGMRVCGEYAPRGKDLPQVNIKAHPKGRNRRTVWTVTTKPFKGAHFATFPPDLIEPCILAGCPKNGVVLDPFFGAGTVGLVAIKHDREFVGIELNPKYIEIAEKRLGIVEGA